MAVTFNEVMEFNPQNREVYEEIQLNLNQLLPFIGAGLTAKVYGTWGMALRELGNNLPSKTQRRKLERLINTGGDAYLRAAQLLENELRPVNMQQSLVNYFSSKKLGNGWDDDPLAHEAISILPWLFDCPLLTTNFDEALEIVYDRHGKRLPTLNPTDQDLVAKATRLMNTCCLFKLHGSVVGTMISNKSLVFTRNQYRCHYGRGSLVRLALRSFVDRRSLFFLGCSLNTDRTMEVLREAAGHGAWHYAIVSCSKERLRDKVQQLGDAGIRAILYEDGRHESVRVVLEKLLEDTNPDAFERLSSSITALQGAGSSSPYVYSSGMTGLVGRDEELDKLRVFVTSAREVFRWWAIVGPGGVGKSRLALELCDRLRRFGWDIVWLGLHDYDKLEDISRLHRRRTLVVADYVQGHERALGMWMESLSSSRYTTLARTEPLKLLLVERLGTDLRQHAQDTTKVVVAKGEDASDDQVALDLDWRERLLEYVVHKDAVRRSCWLDEPLSLRPLTPERLSELIEAFAQAMRDHGFSEHRTPSNTERDTLLQRLRDVDPVLLRPLYAILLTYAWMEGESPASRDEVLDYIVDREQAILEERIERALFLEYPYRDLADACLGLQRCSTATLGQTAEAIRMLCLDEWGVVSRVARERHLLDEDDLLIQAGLERGGKIVPIEPDIVGEYLVFRWLCNEADESRRRSFLSRVWSLPQEASVFFDRLYRDHGALLGEDPMRWLRIMPEVESVDEANAGHFASALQAAAFHAGDLRISEVSTERLERLVKRCPNDDSTVLNLGKSLVYLSLDQDNVGDAERTVSRLEVLHKTYPGNHDVALQLAKALAGLTSRQVDVQTSSETIIKMEALVEAYPGNCNIAHQLAIALVNISGKQRVAEDINEIVTRLEQIVKLFPNDSRITHQYVWVLAHLFPKQDGASAGDTFAKVEKLAELYPDDLYVVKEFAWVLSNIVSKLDDASNIAIIIAKQNSLCKGFPGDLYIAQEQARTIFKFLITYMTQRDIANAAIVVLVGKLQHLVEAFPSDRDISFLLIQVLSRIVAKQNTVEAEVTIGRIEELVGRFPGDRGVRVELAYALANLSAKQDVACAEETICRVEELTGSFPGDRTMVTQLAVALCRIVAKQDTMAAESTVNRIEELASAFPDDRMMQLELAWALANFSSEQDVARAKETICRIEKLTASFPGDQDMVVVLAWALARLTDKQKTKTDIGESTNRIDELSKYCPDNKDFALQYAKALCNLSFVHDKFTAFSIINRLERISLCFPDDSAIAYYLATALANLSYRQRFIGFDTVLGTIARLEKIVETFPNDQDIATQFAYALSDLSTMQSSILEDVDAAKKTIARLEQLVEKFPAVKGISLSLAAALMVLSHKQEDPADALADIVSIERLAKGFDDDTGFPIATRLAKLFYLFKLVSPARWMSLLNAKLRDSTKT